MGDLILTVSLAAALVLVLYALWDLMFELWDWSKDLRAWWGRRND